MKTRTSSMLLGMLFLVTAPVTYAATTPSKLYSYVGTFRFPGITDEKKFPTVPAYYKGSQVAVQEAGYILTDPKKHSDFVIVITLLQAPTANTIARFEVPAGQQYLLCSLQRQPVKKPFSKVETFEETWKTDLQVKQGPFLVPEESLVILVDPACVDSLSRPTWSKEGALLKLPTITFKKDIKESAAFNRSLLASLDVAPFHKKDEVVSQSNKKSTSSFRKS